MPRRVPAQCDPSNFTVKRAQAAALAGVHADLCNALVSLCQRMHECGLFRMHPCGCRGHVIAYAPDDGGAATAHEQPKDLLVIGMHVSAARNFLSEITGHDAYDTASVCDAIDRGVDVLLELRDVGLWCGVFVHATHRGACDPLRHFAWNV